MSILSKDDPTIEPVRITGLGAMITFVGLLLAASGGDLADLATFVLAIGGGFLFVGLTAWGVKVGLAAHAAEHDGPAGD